MQVYGQTENGYYTPYQTTVIYNSNNLFQTALAYLVGRAQLMPCYDETKDIVSACEYLSPDVLILDKLYFGEAEKFTERGFYTVHCFTGFTLDTSSSDSTNEQDAANDITNDITNNKKILHFGVTEIYEHVKLVQGLAAFFVAEYLIAGEYPSYKPRYEQASYLTGKHFMKYLMESPDNIQTTLAAILGGPQGYDILEKAVSQGAAYYHMEEKHANWLIDSGIVAGKFLVLYADTKTLRELAPMHPKVVKNGIKYIAFYNFQTVNLWRLADGEPVEKILSDIANRAHCELIKILSEY